VCRPIPILVGGISPERILSSRDFRIAREAFTAFKLSFPEEKGAPNTAMNPSPRNLFIIPWCQLMMKKSNVALKKLRYPSKAVLG
jgi:hypothetical protein